MKKLILLITTLLLYGSVYTLDFSLLVSFETALDNKSPFDFGLTSEMSLKDKLYAGIEFQRQNDEYFTNYETVISKKWKYFTIETGKEYITSKKRDNIWIQTQGRYPVEWKKKHFLILEFISEGYYSLGLRQQWSHKKPTSYVVFSKTYSRELKFFLTPATIEYKLSFYSADFKNWQKESLVDIKFKILAFVSYKLRYVLKEDWFSLKSGIEVSM